MTMFVLDLKEIFGRIEEEIFKEVSNHYFLIYDKINCFTLKHITANYGYNEQRYRDFG